MQRTFQSIGSTSFHHTTIKCSVSTLIKVLGEPEYSGNDGEDKVNFEWEMETDDGDVFTVYDWKEYRSLNENEMIEWHIGGTSRSVTEQAAREIRDVIAKS
jgi:hypothetical protein